MIAEVRQYTQYIDYEVVSYDRCLFFRNRDYKKIYRMGRAKSLIKLSKSKMKYTILNHLLKGED